jgi:hypothetical protein
MHQLQTVLRTHRQSLARYRLPYAQDHARRSAMPFLPSVLSSRPYEGLTKDGPTSTFDASRLGGIPSEGGSILDTYQRSNLGVMRRCTRGRDRLPCIAGDVTEGLVRRSAFC